MNDPFTDYDGDGYTKQTGDCDEGTSLVSPGAVEFAGNNVDDDCDGTVDEPTNECDTATLNYKTDAESMAYSLGQCDDNLRNATGFKGPSDVQARRVLKKFGSILPMSGETMVLISSGIAAGKSDPGYEAPQSGTDFGNEYTHPTPNDAADPSCGGETPATVNDYTEWVLKLKVPTNAQSFSFDFHFFSSEYPEFVCSQFNDRFVVLMESPIEFQTAKNISFDMAGNPVTVNSGFFTVCTNDPGKPQTQHCTRPVSEIAGTGYEDTDFFDDKPMGGSTGWLTTTAPVTPGEDITLRFIVFDEGDGILDSSALIDNFRWSVDAVEGPITIQ